MISHADLSSAVFFNLLTPIDVRSLSLLQATLILVLLLYAIFLTFEIFYFEIAYLYTYFFLSFFYFLSVFLSIFAATHAANRPTKVGPNTERDAAFGSNQSNSFIACLLHEIG
jgi:hypothetical protein